MIDHEQERRAHPRIEINGDLIYREANSDESRPGLLENLSLEGARIWLERELPASSRVYFRVESESQECSMAFVATLLHLLPRRERELYGYGCAIEAAEPLDEPH